MNKQPEKIPPKLILSVIAAFFLLIVAAYFIGTPNASVIGQKISAPKPIIAGQSTADPGKTEAHVVIVLEENERYADVMGNTQDMPYLNGLADRYATAANYFADTHPSIGNYFMLTAGNVITNKDGFSSTVSDDNIVRHLVAAGKTWKEYSENLPSVGYTGGDQDPYEQHHNPLSYFSDVRDNPAQAQNLVPFSQFAEDLKNNQLPDFSFVVPNNFDNAHDCPGGGSLCSKSQKLETVDNWLKANIDLLLQNSDFNRPGGGVLIVTFDESAKSDTVNGGGHAAWVVAGADVKNGYVSQTLYQHENTLRFMSELLGLTSFPGKADGAAGMGEFLK